MCVCVCVCVCMCVCMCVFIYLSIYQVKVKLVTVVEGGQKAPISKATTLRCTEGHYFFSWIALRCP